MKKNRGLKILLGAVPAVAVLALGAWGAVRAWSLANAEDPAMVPLTRVKRGDVAFTVTAPMASRLA